jgi:FtsH-binding integral membrane protein
MAETFANRGATAGWAGQAEVDEGLRRHMLQVYNYMMVGLALPALVAFVVGSTPALYVPIFGSSLKWVVMLAPLAFVFFFSFKIQSMSTSTAQMTFWAFCAVMGLSMASIFLVFTGASIARVFFITAGMFGAASLYGYTTGADLTLMGSFLLMGLIGIVIASVVNIFIGSSAVQFAVSVIGVIVFTGLAAYDTQAIKETYAANAGVEANGKLAVFGALSLYLSLINLFQMLLQLFGATRDE